MRVVAALLGSLAAHTLVVVALVAVRQPPRAAAPTPTYELEAPVLLTAGLIQVETGGAATPGILAGPGERPSRRGPVAPPGESAAGPGAAASPPPVVPAAAAGPAPGPERAASQPAPASQARATGAGPAGRGVAGAGPGGGAGAGPGGGAGPGEGGGPGGGGPGGAGGPGGGAGAGDPRAIIAARVAAERHYPLLARRRGLEGLVVVEFGVTPAGTAGDLRVVQSAGAILDEAARTAVQRARSLPRVSGRVQVPLRFRLTDPP
jgi:TonB family protein